MRLNINMKTKNLNKPRATEFDKVLGSKIKYLRCSNNWSRSELGNRINVSQQQLAKYENGSNRLCMGRLILIAKTFRKKLSFFFDQEKEEVKNPKNDLAIEFGMNFMRLKNPQHQVAINYLVKNLGENK